MANNIFYSGTSLTNKFQAYDAGNVSGYTPVNTNIKYNGTTDINTILSPRDNKSSNAATSTGAIISNTKDLTLLFNKIGATYDVTVGGFANYANGSVITTGVTYSNKNPTGNGANAPTFTVPNPTVDTVNTTSSAAGTYTFNNSFTSSTVSGGRMVLKAGNYLAGTISGSFTIVSLTINDTPVTSTQHTCEAYLTPSVTIISLSWSRIGGTAGCSITPTNTATVTVNRSVGSGGTSIIQCAITYTIGGTTGNITQTATLQWGPI